MVLKFGLSSMSDTIALRSTFNARIKPTIPDVKVSSSRPNIALNGGKKYTFKLGKTCYNTLIVTVAYFISYA